MPKSGARYALEYRLRMMELVRAGRSPDDLATEFEGPQSCKRAAQVSVSQKLTSKAPGKP